MGVKFVEEVIKGDEGRILVKRREGEFREFRMYVGVESGKKRDNG